MTSEKKLFGGKTVVVTGSSAGIGRAIAYAFAKQGANLGLISRNEQRLKTLQRELETYGARSLVLPLDVADADAVQNAASQVEEQLGPIDIWVNNAMLSVFSPIKEMQPEEYKRVTEVTYLGYVYGTIAALKYMLPRDRGMIIQVGSALACRGVPLQSAYCASKHAIKGFHDCLLSELIHDKSKVKATMVQLSAHNTPQFDWVKSRLPNHVGPMAPIYQPEVAAKAVLWAARHYKREHIIGFPAWKSVCGNILFPSFEDKHLAKTGYTKQQTAEQKRVDQPDNLYRSVDGDFGAHGDFDNRSAEKDLFFEITKYVPFNIIILALVLIILMLVLLF